MKDEKIRKALDSWCEEHIGEGEPLPVLFDDMAYDASIVGITEGGNVVYSLESMVDELMEDEGWTYEEAAEWIDYNTLRALPYASNMGNPPLILYDTRESLLDKYGE